MSKFAARMSTGLGPIYDRLGDPAVYTDRTSSMTDCTVIVDKDLARYGDVAEISGMTAVVSVRVSEVSERPYRRETFTISETGEVFTVDSVLESDGFEHRCLVA